MRAVLILTAAAMTVSASQAAEHSITMAGIAYAPAVVEAKVGDTLVFVNDDGVAHDVFVPTVGFSTDLGSQDPGGKTTLTLRKAGLFDVECMFHDHMHLRVVVRP
ncbi:cupredoxin domain-containing protein [Inquilinus limosus]|uniref:cupredoxin domain-containing protein n=1 Tax=Inquilinus limosus TaxID=171674 RepID=UPI003F1364B7